MLFLAGCTIHCPNSINLGNSIGYNAKLIIGRMKKLVFNIIKCIFHILIAVKTHCIVILILDRKSLNVYERKVIICKLVHNACISYIVKISSSKLLSLSTAYCNGRIIRIINAAGKLNVLFGKDISKLADISFVRFDKFLIRNVLIWLVANDSVFLLNRGVASHFLQSIASCLIVFGRNSNSTFLELVL